MSAPRLLSRHEEKRTGRIVLVSHCDQSLRHVSPHRRLGRVQRPSDRNTVEQRQERRSRPELKVDRSVKADERVSVVVDEVRLGLTRRTLGWKAQSRDQLSIA